jgi:hypothetical protein
LQVFKALIARAAAAHINMDKPAPGRERGNAAPAPLIRHKAELLFCRAAKGMADAGDDLSATKGGTLVIGTDMDVTIRP